VKLVLPSTHLLLTLTPSTSVHCRLDNHTFRSGLASYNMRSPFPGFVANTRSSKLQMQASGLLIPSLVIFVLAGAVNHLRFPSHTALTYEQHLQTSTQWIMPTPIQTLSTHILPINITTRNVYHGQEKCAGLHHHSALTLHILSWKG
jgi:hypothetical protein